MTVDRTSSLSYGLGGAVYAIKEAAYTMFVLLFYTQVLGLSGTATGIVLFIGLVWDAVSDPLMGAWSDRFHSRWGRRHPFMAVSALPLGLGYVGLFNPPSWTLADSTALALWLLGCSLWIRTAVTVFALPHLALAAEMSQDYHERSRLLGQRIGFLFMAAILVPAAGMYLLFGETNGQDGRFISSNYLHYGWLSAVLTWVASLLTIWGTRKYIAATRIAAERMPSSAGASGMLRDFLSTLRNTNFRNLLFYDLAASASYGITVTLNVMAWTYYWELDATEVSIVMGLPVITAVPLAMLILGPLGKRWPKHKILNRAILFMLLDIAWIYALRILGLLPDNGHPVILGLLLLQNCLFIFLFIFRNVSSYSITADLTDEHESESGKRQEAGFFSALAFTTKLASAAGPLYAGIALDLINLKEGMMPGQVSQATLDNLVWVMAIGIIPLMLIAWRFTFKVSMSEEQLCAIQETLREREAQA